MSPKSPTVQGAMAFVSRQMRMPRRVRCVTEKTTPTLHFSPFVSPIVKNLHAHISSSSVAVACTTTKAEASPLSVVSSVSPTSSAKCCDLSHTLRALLHAHHGGVAQDVPPLGKLGPRAQTMGNAACGRTENDVLLRYNPTLDPTIVRRVAEAVDVEGALRRARDVRRAIQSGGGVGVIFSRLRELCPQPTVQEVELGAGIAARLYHGTGGQRQWRPRGFRLYTSDVQVAEVLPSGKIVSFTDPTLPSAAALPWNDSDESEQRPYLHFVLYKEGLSLGRAFSLLSEACEGMCSPADFAANVAMEESAVTVQVCSVRVARPETASCGWCHAAVVRKLLRVNLKPIGLSVQVLAWRSFPCNPLNSHKSQMQYSVLVRGINTTTTTASTTAAAEMTTRTGVSRLEGKALTTFSAFPNFLGPRHFGPLTCPFRTHHAEAAWERNMPAEALVIAACLGDDMATAGSSEWVRKLVDLLRSDEDRPAVLKEWYHLHTPPRLRAQIASSKDALLWNVLASCRICALGGGTAECLPDPGDFVLQCDGSTRGEGRVAKMEFFPENCFGDVTPTARESHDGDLNALNGVVPILTREKGSPYTLRDVVIPFNLRGNEVMEQLSVLLGFRASSRKLESLSHAQLQFRPLFAAGNGHPHARCPWVKTLAVPAGDAVYKLLTDMELRQRVSYTSISRGQPHGVWPIGRYGYRMAERLPAGALSLTASDTARHSAKCFALHFTLPAHAYSMAFFREFTLIESQSASAPWFSNTWWSSEEKRIATKGKQGGDEKNANATAAAAAPAPRHDDDDDDGEFTDGNIMRKRRQHELYEGYATGENQMMPREIGG